MFAALLILSSVLSPSSAIVNGTIPRPHQYPFVVSLQWDERHKCGGALLDANTILTAAHCYPLVWVNPYQSNRVTALLGTRNQHARGTWPSLRVGIRRIIWPDNFPERFKSKEIADVSLNAVPNDYLLLKTKRSIAQTPSVRYALLRSDDPIVGDRCFSIGWGRYKYPDGDNRTANDFPKYLRQGLVKVVSDFYCADKRPIPSTMMCARQVIEDGVPKGIPCFGDSGSPLVCRTADGTQYLAGLAEAAVVPCNDKDATFVYMRIPNIRQWIESKRSA